jgi:predicted nucleotidyltransferase
VADPLTGDELRLRRLQAGLSQRELAARSGVPQPNVAAYERGRRVPAPATQQRLDAALSAPTLDRVRAVREAILGVAQRRHLSHVRVFGSVARGLADAESDIDLLVRPAPGSSVFDLAGFMAEVEEIVGVDVDVVSDRGSGPAMDRIRAEAVPL